MFAWGVIVFVGLWLILADVKPVTKAKLMGNPLLIHAIVIGSGLAIHGGSADGAMAAIVSGWLRPANRTVLPRSMARFVKPLLEAADKAPSEAPLNLVTATSPGVLRCASTKEVALRNAKSTCPCSSRLASGTWALETVRLICTGWRRTLPRVDSSSQNRVA